VRSVGGLRLLAIGDLHDDVHTLRQIVEAVLRLGPSYSPDIVVLTGDLVEFGRSRVSAQASTLRAYDAFLEVFGAPCVCVPGNHDSPQLWGHRGQIASVDVLQAENPLEFAGWRVFGIGGSRKLGGFPYEWRRPEGELAAVVAASVSLQKTSNLPSIMLAHVPPTGIGLDITASGDAAGSLLINEVIQATKPVLCICGHIHEAPGWSTLEETYVTNMGCATMRVPARGRASRATFGAAFKILYLDAAEARHTALDIIASPNGIHVTAHQLQHGQLAASVARWTVE
jgi:uncharacterized protein